MMNDESACAVALDAGFADVVSGLAGVVGLSCAQTDALNARAAPTNNTFFMRRPPPNAEIFRKDSAARDAE
jgi:hypothetical protein